MLISIPHLRVKSSIILTVIVLPQLRILYALAFMNICMLLAAGVLLNGQRLLCRYLLMMYVMSALTIKALKNGCCGAGMDPKSPLLQRPDYLVCTCMAVMYSE